jgi:hypothetical protein
MGMKTKTWKSVVSCTTFLHLGASLRSPRLEFPTAGGFLMGSNRTDRVFPLREKRKRPEREKKEADKKKPKFPDFGINSRP